MTQQTRASLQLSLAMLLSGSIGYFVLIAAQSSINTVLFRCLFGALFLGVYLLWRRPWKQLKITPELIKWALLGGLALIANWLLLFKSFDYVAFSLATAAYHTQPLFLVLAGSWLLGEKNTRDNYLWLAVAFVGLGLLLELDTSGFELSHLSGIALALGAAVLYTAATLAAKKTQHLPPSVLAFVQLLMGSLLLLPWFNFNALPEQSTQWAALLTLGLVHTGFMYILLYASFQVLSTKVIALLSFIYPVVALILDHLAFGTQVSLLQMAGVALILLAATGVKLGWQLFSSQRVSTEH